MKETVKKISDHLLRTQGLDLSRYDESFLEKSILERIRATQCSSASEYLFHISLNSEEGINLYRSLHIGYSEFFRNPLACTILGRQVFPSILSRMKNNRRKEIRVWSAACAGGQEAYSLAILLEECRTMYTEKFSYRIFATDACEKLLDQAQKGLYSITALGNMIPNRTDEWFTRQPHAGAEGREIYAIRQELKEHIEFSVFDLFNEQFSSPTGSLFGDFDLVICANLLFYYRHEYQIQILEKAGRAVTQGGYLVCGETERDFLLRQRYRETYPNSAIFQV